MGEKVFETIIDKIDKKLSTKAFIIVILIIALINVDYDNGILYEAMCITKVSWVIAIVLYLIYKFVIKKRVKDFVWRHDSEIYENYRYSIDCVNTEIIIYHNKKCILWGDEPDVTIKVLNKGKELINNFSGFIDLYCRDTCIIHEKIEIDYILPGLGGEIKILEGDKAYSDWETAMFVCTTDGEREIYSGPLCSSMPDIDYYLIKNKTWHVIKELFDTPVAWFKWVWNGGRYSVRTKADYIMNCIKKYLYRFLLLFAILILSSLAVLLCAWILREWILWGKLHIDTYFVEK